MQLSKAAATVKKQTTICTAVWIISAGMGQYMSDALSRQNPFPTVCHPGAPGKQCRSQVLATVCLSSGSGARRRKTRASPLLQL